MFGTNWCQLKRFGTHLCFVKTFHVFQTNGIRRFKQTTNWPESLTRVFDYKYFELVLSLHLYFSNFPNWSQTGSKQTTRILETSGTPMSISPIYIWWMPVNCSKLFVLVGKCVCLVCLALLWRKSGASLQPVCKRHLWRNPIVLVCPNCQQTALKQIGVAKNICADIRPKWTWENLGRIKESLGHI